MSLINIMEHGLKVIKAETINVTDSDGNFQSNPKTVENVLKEVFQSGTNVKSGVVTTLVSEGASVTTENTWPEVIAAIPTIAGYKSGDKVPISKLGPLVNSRLISTTSSNCQALQMAIGDTYIALNDSTYSAQKKIVVINKFTGALLWSKTDFSNYIAGMDFDENEILYMCDTAGIVYKLDSGTWTLTQLFTITIDAGEYINSLKVDYNGYCYILGTKVRKVNKVTGEVSAIYTEKPSTGASTVDIDKGHNRLIYTNANTPEVVMLDILTMTPSIYNYGGGWLIIKGDYFYTCAGDYITRVPMSNPSAATSYRVVDSTEYDVSKFCVLCPDSQIANNGEFIYFATTDGVLRYRDASGVVSNLGTTMYSNPSCAVYNVDDGTFAFSYANTSATLPIFCSFQSYQLLS